MFIYMQVLPTYLYAKTVNVEEFIESSFVPMYVSK